VQGSSPHSRIDARLDSARREGLTGTAAANLYDFQAPDPDRVTRAPDHRPMDQQPEWRQDFPIDRPEDRYVERREFMKFMVLTSLAFTAGQFWIVAQNWLRRRRGQPPLQRIAGLDDIAVGSVLMFSYPTDTDRCVLLRPAADALVAYSQECTHLSCAVVPRVDTATLHCPCHQGTFDARTGRPLAGPPRRPLPRIVIEVRGSAVYATGVELRTV
jgi:nitrite reductase/ring-hydroxylating ferredoxin subunit